MNDLLFFNLINNYRGIVPVTCEHIFAKISENTGVNIKFKPLDILFNDLNSFTRNLK